MINYFVFYSKELKNPILLREVESSNLDCLGYDEWTGRLFISFGGTTVYSYSGVSGESLAEMLTASLDESKSVGSTFHQLIKDKFTVTKYTDCIRIPLTESKMFETNE